MATPTQGGNVTPFEPGVIDAVSRGIARLLQRGADWFGPGLPLEQTAPQEVEGRQRDYPAQENIQVRPRVYEPIQFQDLRFLADGCELIRLVIETRKDQMVKLRWKIKHRDEQKMKQLARKKRAQQEKLKPPPKPAAKPIVMAPGHQMGAFKTDAPLPFQQAKNDELEQYKQERDKHLSSLMDDPELQASENKIKELEEFFRFPDKRHDFATWFRILLEDLLVLDAPTLYVRRTKGGEVWGFEPIDGATIAPKVDPTGRQPLDGVAFQQTLKGLPAVNYTVEQLVYRPRNKRAFKAYGYSPVEQIVWLANLITRREIHKIRYYTDGSMPDYIMRVPATWTPEQVVKYKKWWDSQFRGDAAARRGTMFVVEGSDPIDMKEKALMDEFDEWLARLVCFAFSIAPQPFVKETNRATAQTQQEASLQEGLEPLKLWAKSLMDELLARMGEGDYEFSWDEEEVMDPLEAAQIAQIYVSAGIKTKDEVRDELGLDPLPEEPEPAPPVITAAPSGDGTQPPEPVAEGGKPPAAAASAQPKAPPIPAKKLEKVKPKHPQINRDRPSVEAARTKIAGGLAERLAVLGKKVSRKVAKVEKREHSKDLGAILSERDWKAISDWLAKELSGVYEDGAQAAGAQIGFSLELPRVNAAIWALDHSAQMMVDVADTTRTGIQDLVAQGAAEGWSADELATELRESYLFSSERADTIARTETAYADIQGNLWAYRESGEVSKVMWLTSDADVCDACADKDGQEFGIDEEEGQPPEHPNCRCDVAPIVDDDDEKVVQAAGIQKAAEPAPVPAQPIHVEVHTAPITINIPENRKPGPQFITFTKNADGETIARLEDTHE